jgi:hypothetical protein
VNTEEPTLKSGSYYCFGTKALRHLLRSPEKVLGRGKKMAAARLSLGSWAHFGCSGDTAGLLTATTASSC